MRRVPSDLFVLGHVVVLESASSSLPVTTPPPPLPSPHKQVSSRTRPQYTTWRTCRTRARSRKRRTPRYPCKRTQSIGFKLRPAKAFDKLEGQLGLWIV